MSEKPYRIEYQQKGEYRVVGPDILSPRSYDKETAEQMAELANIWAASRKELADLREKYSDYHDVSRANGELAKELAKVKASAKDAMDAGYAQGVENTMARASNRIKELEEAVATLAEKATDPDKVNRALMGSLKAAERELAQVKASVHECCGKASGCATAKANEIFRRERDAALSEVAALKAERDEQHRNCVHRHRLQDAESELSALRGLAKKIVCPGPHDGYCDKAEIELADYLAALSTEEPRQ